MLQLLIAVGLALVASVPLAEPLAVAVSVPPQAYFVERIGAANVRVEVMMPSSVSHEQYTPSPRQMLGLSQAQLYVKVGHPAFGMEARVINPFLDDHPALRVVNMSQGVAYREMPEHHHREGEAEEEGPGHAPGDPHVWVAPATVATAVENIAVALTEIDPVHGADYQRNAQQFLGEIAALDAEIQALLAPLTHRRFMVYHPAWGYFADQYRLEQIAIETGGKSPSPERLVKLIDLARREGVKVIFVQSGFATKSAEVIARELGAQVVEIDPLAKDWLSNMRKVARAFQAVMSNGQ